jgi:bacillithiol system protein YtxJ
LVLRSSYSFGKWEITLLEFCDVKAFDDWMVRSKERPVVIFKHSTTCPISSAAYREMSDFEGEVALVQVPGARELSREIENRTGIRHESPQVIILFNGQVVWNASHWKISRESVAEAVRAAEDRN